jgi:hypothetical protein
MEAQRSNSGFEHNAWTQDGTEVKGTLDTRSKRI